MKKHSAGILLFKKADDGVRILLAHPGGPFWKNKDLGSWSIPKGEFVGSENPLDAAVREFEEETGFRLEGKFIPLDPVKMKSGKEILAWALEGDVDLANFRSNDFEMEWPPKSGKIQHFPEIDKIGWFTSDEALTMINGTQSAFLHQLEKLIRNK